MELLTTITTNIAHAGIELLEIAAMGILLYGSGKSIWMLIRHKPHVTLALTRYMNIALIIMLSAEIVRLVTVRKARLGTRRKSIKTTDFSIISRYRQANVSPERVEATKEAMGRVLEARNLSGPALHLQNRIKVWLSGLQAKGEA